MNLKDRKQELKITYLELSKLSGYSIGYLGDVFNGRRMFSVKDDDRLRSLAKALSIDFIEIIEYILLWKDSRFICPWCHRRLRPDNNPLELMGESRATSGKPE